MSSHWCSRTRINKSTCLFPGLTEPVLIRLDVDSKLSDQIKVKRLLFNVF